MIKKGGKRLSRHTRIRKKVLGTAKMPRLSVFKSNKYIYAKFINDKAMLTLAAFSDLMITKEKSGKISKIEVAKKVGENLAKIAAKKKIVKVVFDRGGFKYHGRVKALAQGARAGGLIF